ncbi:hypothetical protein CERSUDRAFT_94077 [Gelatoporia subvermispora B]|uniref:DUF726-domain-containing protein n=1 Tax=Ceriporiopsis subvermispora (strain B) TaxID=914234 RepID=M2PPV2_CERS8|nr:hypothetical protein CERSUDRAFT_94077 [Gelatoporia subvermispora B]
MGDLAKLTPPKELGDDACSVVFQHIYRRLASYRNTAELYAIAECSLSSQPEQRRSRIRDDFMQQINKWAQELLKHAWLACREPGPGKDAPTLDPLSDSSTADLPHLPSQDHLRQLLNTVLFLQITAGKNYSAHTRAFLFAFVPLDEAAIAATLKNPNHAVEEAERKTQIAKEESAAQRKTLRRVGIGLGAVAGGVLIGVTGGLAAPLVGAGVSAVLSFLGVGGTAAGLLATGLASSSVVCGALFGVYGSKRTADMVDRYTRDVHDLAIIPVRDSKETLAVRLCVTGWLDTSEDVAAPWTVFDGDDTFALQWEVQALQELSNALMAMLKSNAMKYVKAQIIKRTVLSGLMAALAPTAWLKIGQIIDNPWMNAKALAAKAGKVLGMLLRERVLGNRPVTLVGYSLGALVVFEALRFLAALPPAESAHLIQDVYLFGAPIPTDEAAWAAVRRVVAGRLVNGYGSNDYVLAVLSRMSDVSWGVAGLQPVQVKGVENVSFEEVDGHVKWRGMVGHCLQQCGAPGIVDSEVQKQLEKKAKKIAEEVDLDEKEVEELVGQGAVEGSAQDNIA